VLLSQGVSIVRYASQSNLPTSSSELSPLTSQAAGLPSGLQPKPIKSLAVSRGTLCCSLPQYRLSVHGAALVVLRESWLPGLLEIGLNSL